MEAGLTGLRPIEGTTQMRVVVVGSVWSNGFSSMRAVDADQDLELTAAVDPSSAGSEDPTGTLNVVKALEDVDASGDVMVDFTIAEAARSNIAWCSQSSTRSCWYQWP